jgi:hypothetical protein|tara:strand:- start:868 stop:1269 length:402 start_codon:yes stop_codon:yes gene_type:complete
MLNIVSSLIPVVSKVIDKALPDPKEQAKAKLLITKELQNAEFQKEKVFRDFVVAYEGSADQIPKFILILRSSVRPILTYVLAGLFIYGFLNPDKINDGTFKMLYQLNVISLGFWYGERALKNLGLNIGGLRKK